MKTHYEILGIEPSAAADEIKRAFRREIAKYHPDKVQHLGHEFQEMAAGIAADLTEAYRVLMDPALRAKYDQELQQPGAPPAEPTRPAPQPVRQAPPPSADAPAVEPKRAPVPPRTPHAGTDLVRRAALARLSAAVAATTGAEPISIPGFDAAYATPAKKGLFKKAEREARVLARVVPRVDAAAIADVWPQALKAGRGDTVCVVLLMGSGLAPANELAAAVSEHRRRSRGAGPVLVPVDVRDWEALFPPETPAAVRSVIDRLRAGD